MDLFDSPDVEVIETPSQEETDQEIKDRIKKEREAQGAFFKTLKTGGATELNNPTSTGLDI